MKNQYPYNKDLKKPAGFGGVDYEKIMLNGSMKAVGAFIRKETAAFRCRKAGLETITIKSFDGAEIPCYVFTPEEAPAEGGYPAMIYYHGGGFMFPIQKPMMINSEIFAVKTGVKVFLPDYRISLDSSCETIMGDCMSVLDYVFEHSDDLKVDRQHVLLYGDSAGGALAASTAIWNRDDRHYPLCGQVLSYPVCDRESWKYESVDRYPDAVWSRSANEAMWRVYLGRGCRDVSRFVPMANDLHGLPPAYVEAAEIDVLHDEARAFAEKLRESGVEVTFRTVPGAYHGYDADLKSPVTRESFVCRFKAIRRMCRH